MTSKTSCFDSAIFKRSLRKTLPLWACYFLFWLFILPGDLISFNYQPEYYDSLTGRLCERILTFCTVGTLLSALIGLLAAWLLFSWLFRANTSYFYAGLPVRREALFLSNFFVGLLMVTLVNLLTALTAVRDRVVDGLRRRLRLLLRHEHTFVCRLLRLCGASGNDHRSGSRHARGICDFKLYQLCPLLLCAVPAVGVCLRHEQYLS